MIKFVCPICKEKIVGFKSFKYHFDTKHKGKIIKKEVEKNGK